MAIDASYGQCCVKALTALAFRRQNVDGN